MNFAIAITSDCAADEVVGESRKPK